MPKRPLTLSKSRYTAGLQCLKRLYLSGHAPGLADPVGPAQQALFDSGARVGALARERYPHGLLIDEGPLQHARAEARTRRALRAENLPAIFEAAFTHDRIRIRVDVLRRAGPDLFDLIEVKSTARVKDEHVEDVAIQLHVLRGAGVRIRRAALLHLNRDYVHPGGAYDLRRLFRLHDLTDEAEDILPALRERLAGMWAVLSAPAPPPIEVGRHCTRPYVCPFYGHCHRDAPAHPVHELYRASPALLDTLQGLGLRDIRDLPDPADAGIPLSPLQDRQRLAVVRNAPIIDPAVTKRLSALPAPVHFLDFETWNPALPVYPGTHPYEIIPFQFSVHVLERDGRTRHREFLHAASDDPRPALARSLIAATDGAGAILAYSGFEGSRIRDLAGALPDQAADLRRIESRLQDLLPLIRDHCYHPDFHGSFSIKNVLPALVSGVGYDDLAIDEGALASIAYSEMIDPGTPPTRAALLRTQLLAYCQRDTEAMLRLFQQLSS
jgi:hypothetical protein